MGFYENQHRQSNVMQFKTVPIFVISLPTAIERRKDIQRQMADKGLDFTFIDAVDGRSLSAKHEAMVDDKWKRKRSGVALSSAEIGCALSHVSVYERMIQQRIARAIILEDDVILTSTFNKLWETGFFASTNEKMLILHHHQGNWARRELRRVRPASPRCYRFHGRVMGAVAYFLQLDAAVQLYEAALPVWTTSDWPLDIGKTLGAKGIEPPLIKHNDEFESQVQQYANRRVPRHVRLMRLFVIPSLLFPKRFGGFMKSRYAWEAVFYRARMSFIARKPFQQLYDK